jgi:hypothetical protein
MKTSLDLLLFLARYICRAASHAAASPSLSSLTREKGDSGGLPLRRRRRWLPPTSDRLSGVGSRWEPWSRRPVSSLVSRFPFLVLLGLGLCLHPAANRAETEVGRTTLQCDVVVGAALVTLAHPIDPTASSLVLRRTDLGAGRTVRRYNREVVLVPSLPVKVPSSPPDLDGRHVDAIFLPECWPTVLAMGSPRWRINHL